MIVDQHQPVVEKYYGPGKMASVLQRLLQESDKVVKDLIEGWEEERSIERKVCLANPNNPLSYPLNKRLDERDCKQYLPCPFRPYTNPKDCVANAHRG